MRPEAGEVESTFMFLRLELITCKSSILIFASGYKMKLIKFLTEGFKGSGLKHQTKVKFCKISDLTLIN